MERFNRRRVGWLLLLAVVGVVGAAYLARPVYRQVKVWRAENLAESALELLEDSSTQEEAWEKARAAHNLAPGNLKVTRALAKVLSVSDPGRALPFWEAAVEISGGANEDRLGLVKIAIQVGKLESVREHLAELEGRIPNDAEFILAKSRYLMRENRIEEAVGEARRLLDLEEIPDEAHLFYVQLTQLSPDPADKRLGIDYLWTLGERRDAIGLTALKNLARYPGKNPQGIRELMQRLAFHPESGGEESLLILELRLELRDITAEEALEEAKTLLNPIEDENLLKLGRWLNQHRLQEQTLAVIDEERARSRKDLFLVRMDALAVLNHWEEISVILNRPNIPIESSLVHLFRMRAYRATNQTRRADIEWEKAILATAGDTQVLWSLVEYASRLNLSDYTRLVLEKLTNQSNSMRRAFESLLKLEQTAGNTVAVRDVLRRMVEIYPDESAVKNDLAYLNFLLNEDVEESVREAEAIVNENPLYLAHRITLALGYLRSGDAPRALSLLEGLNVDWSKVRGQWRIILGTILKASGHGDEAVRIVKGLSEGHSLAGGAGALGGRTGRVSNE